MITKISRMGILPLFLGVRLRSRALALALARGTPLILVALEDLEANEHALAHQSLNFDSLRTRFS